MSKKILVIGAKGRAGAEVVRALVAKDEQVKAGMRSLEEASGLVQRGVEPTLFDYYQPATFETALHGVDRLFIVAPPANPHSDQLILPLVDQAKKAGVAHIVAMTVLGSEQDESSPLQVVEKSIKASALPYTILRPNWFMQNFTTMYLKSIKEQGTLVVPADQAKISFIDARDIGAVAARTLTDSSHYGQTYTLTGPAALDHNELAAILTRVAGYAVKYRPVPLKQLEDNMRSNGAGEETINFMHKLYSAILEGHVTKVSSDVDRVLGRAPISFEQFAQDYAAVFH